MKKNKQIRTFVFVIRIPNHQISMINPANSVVPRDTANGMSDVSEESDYVHGVFAAVVNSSNGGPVTGHSKPIEIFNFYYLSTKGFHEYSMLVYFALLTA